MLESLNHNYSPHIKPDVESASSTAGLRASLTAAARDCLLSYLLTWRAARRSGEGEHDLAGDSRKVDIVSAASSTTPLEKVLLIFLACYRSWTLRSSSYSPSIRDQTTFASCSPGSTTLCSPRSSSLSLTRACTNYSPKSGSRSENTPKFSTSGRGESGFSRKIAAMPG